MPLFAVTDVETTGGFAANHRIIEIAVVIFDGAKLVEVFSSLVNPLREIPGYIQQFTGITNEMVADAPTFDQISIELLRLFEGKIFVAHNVNFDFSFIESAFKQAGYGFSPQRLCTVRSARRFLPNLPGYSLGKICQALQIPLANAHRAEDDALATAHLLEKIIQADVQNELLSNLEKHKKQLNLPPAIAAQIIEELPYKTGVYYFLNEQKKIIYIGKAKNIKKRVLSHFAQPDSTEKKQQFLKEITSIECIETGNELVALLLETREIKKYWPTYNKASKELQPRYGIVDFYNQEGIRNLAVVKVNKYQKCHKLFPDIWRARSYLEKLVQEFGLDRKYCGLEKIGQLKSPLSPQQHNAKIEDAIKYLQIGEESFLLIGNGRAENEKSLVLVEYGNYVGFGFCPDTNIPTSIQQAKSIVSQEPYFYESFWLIDYHLRKFPNQVIRISL